MTSQADILIVGGGLAGCLTALRFSMTQPDAKIVLFEETERLAGHDSWYFFDNDLTPEAREWILPLVAKSWTEYQVRFPKHERSFTSGYHVLRSEDLHAHVAERLAKEIIFNAKAERVSAAQVALEDGRTFEGKVVFDARGKNDLPPPRLNGFHKYLTLELILEEAHDVSAPLIVDATCPQMDGLRLFSILPWDEKRLLVTEEYYSDSPEVNKERISRSIRSFAERKGWKIAETGREESAVLPLPMTAEYLALGSESEPIAIGRRGGYFHASTGASLPDSVRMAEYFASVPLTETTSTKTMREGLQKFRRSWVSRQRFFRVVNRMVFYASEASLRYLILQHLYEQTPDIINRFHAGKSTWSDRLRLLSGKTLLPFDRALKSFTEKTVRERAGV